MWTIYAAIVEMIGKLNHTDHMNLMSQESRLWIAFKMLASFAWMKMSLNMNMWKWVNVKLNKNMNMNMNMNYLHINILEIKGKESSHEREAMKPGKGLHWKD